jgi:hypothetical protein
MAQDAPAIRKAADWASGHKFQMRIEVIPQAMRMIVPRGRT